MKPLFAFFQLSGEFRRLIDRIREGGGGFCLEGAWGTGRVALIGALWRNLRKPFIIITPSHETERQIYEDLWALLGEEAVLVFPLGDISGEFDYTTSRERLLVLERLSENKASVIVTTMGALGKKVVPREVFKGSGIKIREGDEIDRNELILRLALKGYRRAEKVQLPGEFSFRGGIVDIFPASHFVPVRLDFFGDRIESIRQFEVLSQRSTNGLKEVSIYPARELVLEEERVERALGKILEAVEKEANRLERLGRVEEAREFRESCEWEIESLRHLEYFDGLERYFEFLYPDGETLIDYLPEDGVVIFDELGNLEEQFGLRTAECGTTNSSFGPRLSSFSFHQVSFNDLVSRCANKRVIYLSTLSQGPEKPQLGEKFMFSILPAESFNNRLDDLASELKRWQKENWTTIIATAQPGRMIEILGGKDVGGLLREADNLEAKQILVTNCRLYSGFKFPEAGLRVLTDNEIYGWQKIRRPRQRFTEGVPLSSFMELQPGDYVVHINHGIGKYLGIVRQRQEDVEQEYLVIAYAQGDKLYVPAHQIDRVHKYIAPEDHIPTIHRLGTYDWSLTKERVKESVKELAKELLELYAARESQSGFAFSSDTPWQEELEAGFIYEETQDQLQALEEVKRDMESPKPMDRLICGDTGFGKTEIAIRAAFKAVLDGKQVAVLVPTTVLAQQHFNTFQERLSAFPIRVEMLSRFKTRSQQQKILEDLKKGLVDIVIGTHRLIQKDVQFRDLGLVVIDEEQRFGVAHKEKLKQLRKTVDVITMSATPIPRTMHMALSGIRKMSLVNEPPEGRMPIKTYALPYSDGLVKEVILRELGRGGQVYFVHNRVETIDGVAAHLQRLLPGAKIAIAHGQMEEAKLERIMLDFCSGAYDILVCTTIIENGIDIPNVNTIVINDCDQFGLAQLYQLRGRVGRSNRQAYAYLLYRPHKIITEAAKKRIATIKEFADLGGGFKIALRDLEIRGAGNLLGPQQHGFVNAVGFDLYCSLLADAVKELRGEEVKEVPQPKIELKVDAYIPDAYIPDLSQRLEFYRKISLIQDKDGMGEIEEELKDRFGALPGAVKNLLRIVKIKLQCLEAGVDTIDSDRNKIVIKLSREAELSLDEMRSLYYNYKKRARAGEIHILPSFKSDRVSFPAYGLRQTDKFNMVELVLSDLVARKKKSSEGMNLEPACLGGQARRRS